MEGPSLNFYRNQLETALAQVDRSIELWEERRATFVLLLEQWKAFPQLAQNPVDGLRLDFLDQELQKHQTQRGKCQENIKKFDDLERQMRALAVNDVPVTDVQTGEECIDIREELDDDDNITSVKLTPQRHAVLDAVAAVEPALKDSSMTEPKVNGASKEIPPQRENTKVSLVEPSVDEEAAMTPPEGMPTFTLVAGPDGQMEMVADNAGMVPQVAMFDDLQTMNEICESMEDEEDLEEDEYGRTRVEIPIPTSLERKKKIVFAEELHQGPSAGKLRPTTPILKRQTKYPLPDEVPREAIGKGKGNLANLDLDPEDGAEKKPMIIRRLTDDELQVIRQKRQALGKKHKRRKSADPQHPVRSDSWDEHQQDLPDRPQTAIGDADTKESKVARAKELLAAQNDIAWANAPISPDDSPQIRPTVVAPKPRKPPTPERQGSWNVNIPSPLSQSTVPSPAKEVAFSETVTAKLAPLADEVVVPTVVERRERKRPPADKQPSRQSSIDPMVLSPTPRSPPPQDRERGPVTTEGQGSVSHYMVRSTAKSPPPHIAIHDLLGDQPAEVNDAVRGEALGFVEPQKPAHPDEILPTSVKDHQVMTDGVVERNAMPILLSESQQDEADLAMHKKEAAQAYHKLRSRMIQAQGGYIEQEEEVEDVPLEEKPKMSRFKAARLARTQ
ncbi:hypothetical protein BCR37DRAFT_392823 [Protomyces lactucae-debilis]|uniref:DUF3835 domain-containing protein n=1 Tax=Protomyces lactucae-debilis TaxID=2754530 RepID=A0A1Y2FFD4_PROLT|nr:uncharacterized protein BCR37DRAFT_392823 [Protomyces lactucae-debilis]ORY82621.1 hypothetical protein BCR37DRAFT_392823 [Protomyces lactucae-debilis]